MYIYAIPSAYYTLTRDVDRRIV